jgi:hypothetical protein
MGQGKPENNVTLGQHSCKQMPLKAKSKSLSEQNIF